MDDEAPKPMKKVHRNIFRKVGRKLEKFEQSLGVLSSNSSHSFGSSNDVSSNYDRTNSENNGEQDDTMSLQYLPNSDSPKAILRHKQCILFILKLLKD
jgi:hypothetical protein